MIRCAWNYINLWTPYCTLLNYRMGFSVSSSSKEAQQNPQGRYFLVSLKMIFFKNCLNIFKRNLYLIWKISCQLSLKLAKSVSLENAFNAFIEIMEACNFHLQFHYCLLDARVPLKFQISVLNSISNLLFVYIILIIFIFLFIEDSDFYFESKSLSLLKLL